MSEDSGRETVEHLQAAAVEMIRATRAFLDLLEDLVEDAAPLAALLGDVTADLVAKGRSAAGGAGGTAPQSGEPPAPPEIGWLQ